MAQNSLASVAVVVEEVGHRTVGAAVVEVAAAVACNSASPEEVHSWEQEQSSWAWLELGAEGHSLAWPQLGGEEEAEHSWAWLGAVVAAYRLALLEEEVGEVGG